MPDGSAFSKAPTFSWSATIGGEPLEGKEQTMTIEGLGIFAFKIPLTATELISTIGFTFKYDTVSQTYGQPVVISQPSQMIVDFHSENGLYVYNVTNKIYFQAWATKDRADVFEFKKASLKLKDPTGKRKDATILDGTVATTHRGKGMFSFRLDAGWQPYLEIPLDNGEIITKDLNLRFHEYYQNTHEITYTVANKDRVMENFENLRLIFRTNS